MLQISELSKTYPNGKKALKDVNLEIPRGMFGLLGPNGAGKSTLMRILATLQEASSGTVSLDGLDVLNQKQEIKRILGYLPQEFDFYKSERAYDLLMHFALLKGITDKNERRQTVESLLHKVNLWEVRNTKLRTFSGGMKQRMGIATILLGNPTLLIVDEPTSGLDPDERSRFHNLLSELGEEIVVILSTHIVDDVSDLCTHMAIIDQGEIIFKGVPEQSIAALEGQVWERHVDKAELAEFTARYHVISSRLFAGKTIIRVKQDANPGDGFAAIEATLEDVYFLALKAAH